MKIHLLFLFIAITAISSNKIQFISDNPNESLTELPVLPFIESIRSLAARAFDIYNSTDYNTSLTKQKLEEKGFSYFKGKCSLENISGVRPERLSSFLKRLLGRLDVPEDHIEQLYDQMSETILNKDSSINFKMFNILFNQETIQNKKVNYVVLLSKFNERKTIDFVHLTMRGDLDVTANVLVLNEYLNKEKELTPVKSLIKRLPEEAEPEKMKTVMAYVELVVLHQLGHAYELEMPKPLPLPKPKPVEPDVKPPVTP